MSKAFATKRCPRWWLLLVILFALVGCQAASSPTAGPLRPLEPLRPLPLPSATATPTVQVEAPKRPVPEPGQPTSEPRKLLILHTNDTAGYLDPCG